MGNWMTGLGEGIQNAGNTWAQSVQAKEQRRLQDEAIQRALAQQGTENQFRSDQLEMQRTQANDQRRLTDSTIAQNVVENEGRQFEQALKAASNFPGANLPPSQAEEWLKDSRAPMVQSIPGMTFGEATAAADKLPTFDQAQAGMKGNQSQGLATLIAAGGRENFEGGGPSYALRPSESERMRINTSNNNVKLQVAQMRDGFLRQKLQSDEGLKQATLALGEARLQSMIEQHETMMGFRYDNMDMQAATANAKMLADNIEAEIRAEASKNMFMIPGLVMPGQGAAGPAGPARTPRAVPQVPTTPRRQGVAPGIDPAADPVAGGGGRPSLADRARATLAAKQPQ